MKKLLFICWDGPQVNYLEGLFLPIFAGLRDSYKIYVLQFSWNDKERVAQLKKACETAGITFSHFAILRKPHPVVGMGFSLAVGARHLKKYIKLNGIEIVMPRSNFPALMSLYALRGEPSIKFIFDADGLPLEEKVDFDGLTTESLQYKLLKMMEFKTIEMADAIITRTDKAVDYLTEKAPTLKNKFFKVKNGRDINFFNQINNRNDVRRELGLNETSLLVIYAGSLGPQYGVREMLSLFNYIIQINKDSYFLILSNQREFLDNPDIKSLLNDQVIIKNVPFQKVPAYLSAADIGLALREPFFSMIGVAPIKIGEYLLSYLPVIASAGIGDTDAVLKDQACCLVLKNHKNESLVNAAEWAVNIYQNSKFKVDARNLGIKEFSLESSIKSYKVALSHLN